MLNQPLDIITSDELEHLRAAIDSVRRIKGHEAASPLETIYLKIEFLNTLAQPSSRQREKVNSP